MGGTGPRSLTKAGGGGFRPNRSLREEKKAGDQFVDHTHSEGGERPAGSLEQGEYRIKRGGGRAIAHNRGTAARKKKKRKLSRVTQKQINGGGDERK